MEISKEDYSVEMEKNRGRVKISGTLRLLNVEEYEPIIAVIETALEQSGRGKAVIDIKDLDYLNSAGIASLSRFVAGYDKKNFGNVEFKGNKDRYWQIKFLDNLKKLRSEIKTS
ncbi:hypothetical protein CH379_000370 [Leptospira ellisii]|uniref:STAS domain-containing protein n=1 Tax=Leptospira ellisii TaxID=2023197 RepID=A0A2N0BL94_9LEPT|nr:hypothetical protein [Leptospira ellisii]MDV6234089.1 hypothetical protein [Leptospira ellisii]PJZ92042.1 hypothetical protein CH379_15285 [Leptospira ellisii]PKA04781.1 hypothetical protein CH375_08950 [Leptospira ellisii]